MSTDPLFTVPELSRELHITERTIRFYETKGLVKPRRVGKTRIFNYKDRARLVIVLRAKKLGFPLSEIKTYLELYDVDPNHHKQSQNALKAIKQRLIKLRDQQKEIKALVAELKQLEKEIKFSLKNN
tara:strand:+ start:69 stop:449 length:381 start_codon:yes stop_codon:yes gene_type:complete